VILNNLILGTTSKEYSSKQQLDMPHLIVSSSETTNKEGRLKVWIIGITEDTVELQLPGVSSDYTIPKLLKIDKRGNIFLARHIYGYDWREEWLKYDREGNLLARIEISPREEYEWVTDYRVITNEGSIYYWENNEQGVKIIQLVEVQGE